MFYLFIIFALFSGSAFAGTIDMVSTPLGYAVLAIFVVAYIFVILEEKLHLPKSKPVMVAAGLIWMLIAIAMLGVPGANVEDAIRHNFLEYAELFFFLLVAMTYINAMNERGVFDRLRAWLVTRGYSYKQLYWITGVLAFFISPLADNLTTALIMCAVVVSVGAKAPKFIGMSCVSIVVAANAGGAFSPFGDITTLMVWQKGMVEFAEFFALFLPAVVNYLVPAAIISLFVPSGSPESVVDNAKIKFGGLGVVYLFLLTVLTAIAFHVFLHLPPVYGMMLGLGYLKLYGYFIKRRGVTWNKSFENPPGVSDDDFDFDVFRKIAGAEWDTLLFFYGVILAVGGLGYLGYLGVVSVGLYENFGPTWANILVGILSAVIDNIPVMFAVLSMEPQMDHSQWLLVTLTAGVGGSLLSVGSAAGVALMGQARGHYTFMTHLKWTPVIALGYAGSIAVHLLLN